jgi:hypothetical protein
MLSLDGLPDLRDNGGNSSFGDVGPGSISTQAVGRFHDVLRPYEHSFIELVAGRAMDAFGYDRTGVEAAWRDRVAFAAVHLPVHATRMFAWLTLARWRRFRGERVPARRLAEPGGELNEVVAT